MSSRLAIPNESSELALTVGGKRNRLQRVDFLAFADHLAITPAYAEQKIAELLNLRGEFMQMIAASTLSAGLRECLSGIIADRLDRLG